jgi:hypothetical protein
VVQFEIGFGFLGPVAEALFVRRQMARTFTQRQKILPSLLAKAEEENAGN